jgi:hypothetical protein
MGRPVASQRRGPTAGAQRAQEDRDMSDRALLIVLLYLIFCFLFGVAIGKHLRDRNK